MAADILQQFRLDNPLPIDTRFRVDTVVERNALPAAVVYEGLETYVTGTNSYYTYTGADETNSAGLWVERTGSSSNTGPDTNTFATYDSSTRTITFADSTTTVLFSGDYSNLDNIPTSFNPDLSNVDSDNIDEGVSNLYYTVDRVMALIESRSITEYSPSAAYNSGEHLIVSTGLNRGLYEVLQAIQANSGIQITSTANFVKRTAFITDAQVAQITTNTSNLNTHASSTTNPHQVTLAQVGGGVRVSSFDNLLSDTTIIKSAGTIAVVTASEHFDIRTSVPESSAEEANVGSSRFPIVAQNDGSGNYSLSFPQSPVGQPLSTGDTASFFIIPDGGGFTKGQEGLLVEGVTISSQTGSFGGQNIAATLALTEAQFNVISDIDGVASQIIGSGEVLGIPYNQLYIFERSTVPIHTIASTYFYQGDPQTVAGITSANDWIDQDIASNTRGGIGGGSNVDTSTLVTDTDAQTNSAGDITGFRIGTTIRNLASSGQGVTTNQALTIAGVPQLHSATTTYVSRSQVLQDNKVWSNPTAITTARAFSTTDWEDTGARYNLFSSIAVSGQNSITADTVDDTLTLVAGAGITITTDSTNDSITITSTSTGSGVASGTTLPTAAATTDELFYLTAVQGTNAIGLYRRLSTQTAWTAVGGGSNSFTTLREQTISPAYAFTYNFTGVTAQRLLTIDGVPADMELNASSYTLTEVNPNSGASTTVSIAVVSYTDSTNELVLASDITGLALGDNVLTFTRTGMFTQLESDAANTDIEGDLNVNRGLSLPNIPTSDSGRAGTVWSDNGTLVLAGFTALEDAPDWSATSAYTARDVANNRGGLYKLNQDIGAAVDVTMVPDPTGTVSISTINHSINSGLVVSPGARLIISYRNADGTPANAPAIVAGQSYRFVINAGSLRYAFRIPAGNLITTSTANTQVEVVRAGVPGPGVVFDFATTEDPDLPANQALSIVRVLGQPVQQQVNGSSISYGVGDANPSPSDDPRWRNISSEIFGPSRSALAPHNLVTFDVVPDGTDGPIVDLDNGAREQVNATVFRIFEENAGTVSPPVSGLQLITFSNAATAAFFTAGSYVAVVNSSFGYRAIAYIQNGPSDGVITTEFQARFKVISVATSNGETVIAKDDSGIIAGVGSGQEVGSVFQLGLLDNILKVSSTHQSTSQMTITENVSTTETFRVNLDGFRRSNEFNADADLILDPAENFGNRVIAFCSGTVAGIQENYGEVPGATPDRTTNEIDISADGGLESLHAIVAGNVIDLNGKTVAVDSSTDPDGFHNIRISGIDGINDRNVPERGSGGIVTFVRSTLVVETASGHATIGSSDDSIDIAIAKDNINLTVANPAVITSDTVATSQATSGNGSASISGGALTVVFPPSSTNTNTGTNAATADAVNLITYTGAAAPLTANPVIPYNFIEVTEAQLAVIVADTNLIDTTAYYVVLPTPVTQPAALPEPEPLPAFAISFIPGFNSPVNVSTTTSDVTITDDTIEIDLVFAVDNPGSTSNNIPTIQVPIIANDGTTIPRPSSSRVALVYELDGVAQALGARATIGTDGAIVLTGAFGADTSWDDIGTQTVTINIQYPNNN